MSTIEIAHSILNRFSEEELNRFIAYFGIIYPVSDTNEIKKTMTFQNSEHLLMILLNAEPRLREWNNYVVLCLILMKNLNWPATEKRNTETALFT